MKHKELYTVAVVGATGAVGTEMIEILEERKFPVGALVPLASARSAGDTVSFQGQDLTVQELAEHSFARVDIALTGPELRALYPEEDLTDAEEPQICADRGQGRRSGDR